MPKFLRARPPLDDSEAGKIRRLAGARHAPADWSERARIIALSWDGLAVAAIAASAGCHENTVRRWLHRFNADGIDGLGDRPGAGRKRRITEAQRSAIIALARSEPPGRLARDADGELSADDERGPAQWTLDTLAQAARDKGIAVGRSQVRRILRAEKVRWRQTRSWATSSPTAAPRRMPGRCGGGAGRAARAAGDGRHDPPLCDDTPVQSLLIASDRRSADRDR
jgi:transposase